jgi:maltoporin
MYRGDDIYLLDWWPLDNLNTVGGGVRLALDHSRGETSGFAGPKETSFAIHAGMNRPLDPFYFQARPSSSPTGFGSINVLTLDRPRLIVSEKATHIERLNADGMGAKLVLYSEQHSIARGTFTSDAGDKQQLPSDSGLVYGAQVGFFTGHRDTFVNLFVRYATGIAAYGDNTVPSALSPDKSTNGAHELLAAISANYETGPFGLLAGGYVRGFKDASGNPYSRNTYNEGTLTLRPQVWFAKFLGLAVEGSYQYLSSAGVDDNGNPIRAKLWKLGVMPFLTPAGPGSFTRPHLRIIYAYTHRDDGARGLYAPDDKFARRNDEHFLGLGVEWWFNSSYR